MIKLIDRYGIEIVKKGELLFSWTKREIIDKVYFEGRSQCVLIMLSQIRNASPKLKLAHKKM